MSRLKPRSQFAGLRRPVSCREGLRVVRASLQITTILLRSTSEFPMQSYARDLRVYEGLLIAEKLLRVIGPGDIGFH
jgi:hypothetical protein